MPETSCNEINQTISSGILTLQFNRPDKKNAITQAMYATLAQALNEANSNQQIQVAYLTGTENMFTAGNDIADFESGSATSGNSPVVQFLYALANFEKPLVVAANGPAIGVGTTLMLHSDFVILGEEAKLQMPFVNLGLCPEAASSLLLPSRVGYAKSAEWLMLGSRFTAQEALNAGLVNEVTSTDRYQERAMEIATQLTQLPSAAIKETKRLLKRATKEEVINTINLECATFFHRLNSPEAKEAFSAFREKRSPNFKQFNE